MTRALFVWLHRWTGLLMAAFLIIVGLTGSLLAFWGELNHWLTPELFPGPRAGIALDAATLDAATLARRAEALAPQARVDTIFLGYPGAVVVGVSPRLSDPTLPFNQLFLDPLDGHELGRRKVGGLPVHVDQIMPFVYQLHMHLALGSIGEWILGAVALTWTLDCFVGFYLTLPAGGERSRKSFLARWKSSWLVKFKSSFYRVNFDLHRAAGLWLWAILVVFAWSSVSFKLPNFYTRATQLVLDYETPVWAQARTPPNDARAPMEWEAAQATGERLMEEQARQHGFHHRTPAGALSHARQGPLRISGALVARHRRQGGVNFDPVRFALRRTEGPPPAHGSSQRNDADHLARRIAHGQSLRPSLPRLRLRNGTRRRDALRDWRLHLVEETCRAAGACAADERRGRRRRSERPRDFDPDVLLILME